MPVSRAQRDARKGLRYRDLCELQSPPTVSAYAYLASGSSQSNPNRANAIVSYAFCRPRS